MAGSAVVGSQPLMVPAGSREPRTPARSQQMTARAELVLLNNQFPVVKARAPWTTADLPVPFWAQAALSAMDFNAIAEANVVTGNQYAAGLPGKGG